jgi:predicted TIM-barrel fold metal-dependent hydrolase
MIPTITLEEHFISEAVRNSSSVTNLALHMFPAEVRENLFSLGEKRIADMDKGEVSLQVVSSIPGLEPPDICRATNLQLVEAIRKNPTRFAGFACLPMGIPVAAAAELEYCVKELGFVGTLIPNHAAGTHYDGEEYYPFWEKAQDLDVPVYLHPTPPSPGQRRYFEGNYPPGLAQIMSQQVWGWHADVAVHVLRLYSSGLFDKFPKLKLVIGHMGEMMPYMIERIQVRMTKNWGSHKRGFLTVWAENVWITTSGMFYLGPMACLLRAVKIDRILYSVDYPLENHSDGVKFIRDLQESGMVTKEELEMITYKNAEKLLGVKANNRA